MRGIGRVLLPAALLCAGVACGNATSSHPSTTSYDWQLPPGFPTPVVPDDNPMTDAKVELGRRLFFDTRLSRNGTQSCGSCHKQELAFTDGLTTSVGSTGETHPRNSPSIANAAYRPALTWANPLLTTFEHQALVPMFGERPVELGFVGGEDELVARLENDADTLARFQAAFPDHADEPVSIATLTRALGAFQRTVVTGRSPYDRAVYGGEPAALSDSARRGMDLFFAGRLECDHCHGGLDFSGAIHREGKTDDPPKFENNGLYNLDGHGAYPPDNPGIYAVTTDPADMGRFRPPSLRNVAVTAPYMHDGSIATLAEVVDHYARGGRLITSGPLAGDGARSPLKSPLVSGFSLAPSEKADLIAFLESLTDPELVSDPRFAAPPP
ncbi:MAG: di-heme enzyme [bacterium]